LVAVSGDSIRNKPSENITEAHVADARSEGGLTALDFAPASTLDCLTKKAAKSGINQR
jgi:hypothetical protein